MLQFDFLIQIWIQSTPPDHSLDPDVNPDMCISNFSGYHPLGASLYQWDPLGFVYVGVSGQNARQFRKLLSVYKVYYSCFNLIRAARSWIVLTN